MCNFRRNYLYLLFVAYTCKLAGAFSPDLHACLFCVNCAITIAKCLTMLNNVMIDL